jgi:hypothetical protein
VLKKLTDNVGRDSSFLETGRPNGVREAARAVLVKAPTRGRVIRPVRRAQEINLDVIDRQIAIVRDPHEVAGLFVFVKLRKTSLACRASTSARSSRRWRISHHNPRASPPNASMLPMPAIQSGTLPQLTALLANSTCPWSGPAVACVEGSCGGRSMARPVPPRRQVLRQGCRYARVGPGSSRRPVPSGLPPHRRWSAICANRRGRPLGPAALRYPGMTSLARGIVFHQVSRLNLCTIPPTRVRSR